MICLATACAFYGVDRRGALQPYATVGIAVCGITATMMAGGIRQEPHPARGPRRGL
jgi:hypothetical protein